MKIPAGIAPVLVENLPLPVFLATEGGLRALNPLAERLRAECSRLGGEDEERLARLLEGAWTLELPEGRLLLPGLDGAARRRAEQLESFGRQTGGIVHNLNNPLNALSGMIQLMMFRNMELPELERLDAQTDELAAQIRQLGDRYRRLHEYDRGAPLTWELVVREELRFYRADSALKHRCELSLDLPADLPCPLPYREASWLVDRLLEAVLLLVPHDDMSDLRADLPEGWPRFRLIKPNLAHAEQALGSLTCGLMLDLLASCGRRLHWSADGEEAVAATAPLDE